MPITPHIAIIGALLASPARAESDYHTNNRELCRSAIAGIYLTQYDECQRNRDLVTVIERKLKDLRQLKKQSDSKLASLKKKSNQNDFNLDQARNDQEARAAISLLTAQVHDMEETLVTAKRDNSACQDHEKKLARAMEGAFKITKTAETGRGTTLGAYPFQINYKSDCPPMRALCPLPRREAQQLKDLAKAYDTADKALEPCRRYASYTNIP